MFNKILVPLDGSEMAECVFPYVEDIAKKRNSKVEAVFVVEHYEMPFYGSVIYDEKNLEEIEQSAIDGAEQYMGTVKSRLDSMGIDIEYAVLEGKIADTLVDHAGNNGFDLIIMATHGRSGLARWVVGSIADKVVHYSTIPVLLIRSTGQE
ncbi:MAG: universal stress protein [Dehalococcoidia bacterium]|nr:MAG: universal stress protein [Dehalococcoidia bacterium]